MSSPWDTPVGSDIASELPKGIGGGARGPWPSPERLGGPRGVGREGTGSWPPSAPLFIVRRPPIANVFTGKMYLRAPSNDEKFLRKVPPMTTVRRPPWVKWRPPSFCPSPLRDFLNTLLGGGAQAPGYFLQTLDKTHFTRKKNLYQSFNHVPLVTRGAPDDPMGPCSHPKAPVSGEPGRMGP